MRGRGGDGWIAFVLAVMHVLPFCETERLVPIIMFEVDLGFVGRFHGLEPVVIHHVVLQSDVAHVEAHDEWDRLCMACAGPHVDVAA